MTESSGADRGHPGSRAPDVERQVAELEGLLREHQPVDAAEAESVAGILDLLAACADPWSRAGYVPGHLTASAVVVDGARARNALLVFHQKLERWLQPGGHFEPGERDPAEAAAREAREETGLEVRWPPGAAPRLLDVDVHVIPARRDEPEHRHFDLRFLLLAEGNPVAGEGVREARWIRREALEGLDLDPGLLRALNKVAWADPAY